MHAVSVFVFTLQKLSSVLICPELLLVKSKGVSLITSPAGPGLRKADLNHTTGTEALKWNNFHMLIQFLWNYSLPGDITIQSLASISYALTSSCYAAVSHTTSARLLSTRVRCFHMYLYIACTTEVKAWPQRILNAFLKSRLQMGFFEKVIVFSKEGCVF